MKRKPPPTCDHIGCFFTSPRFLTCGPLYVSFDFAGVTLLLHLSLLLNFSNRKAGRFVQLVAHACCYETCYKST